MVITYQLLGTTLVHSQSVPIGLEASAIPIKGKLHCIVFVI